MTGYNDPTYQRNRRSILAGSPLCHWCQKNPATQADHLIELDRGGDHSLENLVPSCASCNASRGAQHLNRKTQQRIHDRTKALETKPRLVLDHEALTPSPTSQILLDGPNQVGSVSFPLDDRPSGRIEPRLVTPVVGKGTRGQELAEWASRNLGIELMPWQKMALEGQLATDATGDFVFREALISTARQNGKSYALKALAAWWIVEEARRRKEPQHVLLVANKLERSMPMYREVAIWLEEHHGATCRWAAGSTLTTMPDGSTFRVAAARDNTHGLTLDLILIDEIWDIAPSVVFDALRPSMIARKNPLMSAWSTAGDESSATMLRLREQAIAAIDAGKPGRLFLAEWSMPPGVDPADRRYWPYANPALGTTITWEALEAQAEGGDRNAFMRAHLNLWVAAARSWLPPGLWDQRRYTGDIPTGGWLAIDTSVDDSRYVGVRAVEVDKTVVVTTEFVVDSETELWDRVTEIMGDPTVKLLATPGLHLHCPLPLVRRATTVGYGELLKYTEIIRKSIMEGKVLHDGSHALAEHVARAVLVKTQASVVLSSQKSPGPIELARTMVWAAAEATRPRYKMKASFAAS